MIIIVYYHQTIALLDFFLKKAVDSHPEF